MQCCVSGANCGSVLSALSSVSLTYSMRCFDVRLMIVSDFSDCSILVIHLLFEICYCFCDWLVLLHRHINI